MACPALLLCLASAAAHAQPQAERTAAGPFGSVVLLPPPSELRVDGLDAAVISEPRPRFSFAHGDTSQLPRGAAQASYRLTVSAALGAGGAPRQLWDSGDVSSDACSQLEYAGPALAPFTRYSWSAQWQAAGGQRSARATSTFETGPMAMPDWRNASWLSGGTQLRAAWELPAGAKVVRARAYVAAPGCHALLVNGATPQPDLRGVCPWVAGARSAVPDFARSRTNVRFMTHDITALLNATGGANALGLLSGHVMLVGNHSAADVDKTKDPVFGTPLAMALFMADLADGRRAFMATTPEAGWRQRDSYVTVSHAWATNIDWTKEEAGWATPAFQPGPQWTPAQLSPSRNAPRALGMPVSTVLASHTPASVRALPGGRHWLYTFERQIVGTVKVKALPSAAAGSRLVIRSGEWLEDDRSKGAGAVNLGNDSLPTIAGDQQQYENYTLRAGDTRPLETLFCWHGFQYVLVHDERGDTGFSGELDAITALEIRTNLSETGTLRFGGHDEASQRAARVFQGVDRMTRNSHLANVAAYIPTDCPTRE